MATSFSLGRNDESVKNTRVSALLDTHSAGAPASSCEVTINKQMHKRLLVCLGCAGTYQVSWVVFFSKF